MRGRLVFVRTHLSSPTTTTATTVLVLFTPCRYQRTGNSKVHIPSWEEKVKSKEIEEKRKKKQEEQEEVARRLRRRTASEKSKGRRSWTAPSSSTASSSPSEEDPHFVSLDQQPRFTIFSYFSRFNQVPINPLHNAQTFVKRWTDPTSRVEEAKYDPERRASLRLLQALQLTKNRKKSAKPQDIQLSEEQQNEMVYAHVSQKWWGRFYRPFRNITESQLSFWHTLTLIAIFVLCAALVVVAMILYEWEVGQIISLPPDDQRDYLYLVQGMRYGDIYHLIDEVRRKEDPLGALPPTALMHLVMEEARRRGWTTMDWEVENRKRHPRSAFQEGDIYHILYWGLLSVGLLISGGSSSGSLITDEAFNLINLKEKNQEYDKEKVFVEGPPTKDEAKRTFW